MDTSVTIIGLIITLIIAIPFFFAMRSNSVKSRRINEIKKQNNQNDRFNFELTKSQNKKVLTIDQKNKGFLLMNFNSGKETTHFVNLNEVLSCKLIATAEKSSNTTEKIEFEFTYKDNDKKDLIVFYNMEDEIHEQVCLYEDHQLALKWVKIIEDCLVR